MRPPETSTATLKRFQPVDWTSWLLWVLISALGLIFGTVAMGAMNFVVPQPDPNHALKLNMLLAFIAVALLAPPILQGLVLKRIVPKLSIGLWFACIGFSAVIWYLLSQRFPLQRHPELDTDRAWPVTWRDDTKGGETVVRNALSGRERQRIASSAQQPLQLPPNGRGHVRRRQQYVSHLRGEELIARFCCIGDPKGEV